jgi:hypothetical protein
MKHRVSLAVCTFVVALTATAPAPLYAEDAIENAGVVTGVTAGNMWFLPIKAMSVGWGAIAGALSYVVTLGNADLTQQIWRDTREGPYVITPEVARMGIGQRPELLEQKRPATMP